MAKKKLISILHVENVVQKLSSEDVKIKRIPVDFIFLFQGQKTISAILLLKGTVEIISGKETIPISGKNILLLHEEFIKSRPVKYTVKLMKGALVVWVDRITVNAFYNAGTKVSNGRT